MKISYLEGIVLVSYFFNNAKKNLKFFIYKPYIIIAVIQLFHINSSTNFFTPIFNFVITLFIPLIGIFSLRYHHQQLKTCDNIFFNIFYNFICPYEIGILQSLKDGYSLSDFWIFRIWFNWPISKCHSASITLATSLIVIIYFLIDGSLNKKYLFQYSYWVFIF